MQRERLIVRWFPRENERTQWAVAFRDFARGNVALIGVTTARATAPFMANGFFLEGQAERLREVLDATARRGLFRVIMIHHPPIRGAVSPPKRLFGISRFHKVIHRHGAELVQHGHSHVPSLFFIGARNVRIPVLCTGAFQSRRGIEQALDDGDCDAVTIARPLVANPDLPLKLKHAVEEGVRSLPCPARL